MLKRISLLAVSVFAFGTAHAGNEVGLYFTPSADLNTGPSGTRVEALGDGFGLIGKFDVFGPAYITAEYSAVTYDEQTANDADLNQARVGMGAKFPLPVSGLSATAQAEIINIDYETAGTDFSEVGGGLHGGLLWEPNPMFSVRGQAGYIAVDDLEGGEFKFGVDVHAGKRVTLFSDYRLTSLENTDNNDSKFDFDDFHLGASFNF